MITKCNLVVLAALALILVAAPKSTSAVPAVKAMSRVQSNTSMYMVYYKKPGWSKWKSCGPYSYSKACKVADMLEDQGCKTSIKRAN